MLSPAPAAQDFFWDDLLDYIGERRVIPIIGAELLTVPDEAGGEAPLMRVLAQKLAERLRVSADDCTGDDALHQVVCRYMQRGGRREEVYPRIRTLLKELAPNRAADPPRPRAHPAFQRLRHDDLRFAARAGARRREARRRAAHGLARLFAEQQHRPARRRAPQRHADGFSPARPALGLAGLRDHGGGHAGVFHREAVGVEAAQRAM